MRIEYPRHARELVFYLPIKKLKFLIADADKDFKAAGNFRTGKEGWMKLRFRVQGSGLKIEVVSCKATVIVEDRSLVKTIKKGIDARDKN